MDHAKLLDVMTSLPVSRSILPPAVYFATSCPANHAICSFIDSSGYASGPIRRCLFIATNQRVVAAQRQQQGLVAVTIRGSVLFYSSAI